MELIILGTGAALVILMLRNVLGRKTGNEGQGSSPISSRDALNQPAHQRPTTQVEPINAIGSDESDIDNFAEPGSNLSQALTEIQLADKSFEPQSFLTGAKAAYEMIVVAFAGGDKKDLKPLLSSEVYKNFESVIDGRKKRGETVETTFIGIDNAKMTGAALTGRIAEITIRFVSELISTTKNKDGAIIEGDPNQIFKVTDIWTFAHDVKSSDPNWELTATASG